MWDACGKGSADLFPAGNHKGGSSGKWLRNGKRDDERHGFQSCVSAYGTVGFSSLIHHFFFVGLQQLRSFKEMVVNVIHNKETYSLNWHE